MTVTQAIVADLVAAAGERARSRGWPGQRHRLCITKLCRCLNRWPTRKTKAKQFGAFVKCLTRCIVIQIEPKEGIFVGPAGVCLVKGGPNKEMALALIDMLADAGKVWIQTHFNHPREITPEAANDRRAVYVLPNASWSRRVNGAFLRKGFKDWVDKGFPRDPVTGAAPKELMRRGWDSWVSLRLSHQNAHEYRTDLFGRGRDQAAPCSRV